MTPRQPTPFPGATGVSGLSVYEWPAVDGRCGGSPHVHLACTEGYLAVAGEGAVQTLTAAGLREVALRPGSIAWFGPGTIHRAIASGEGLRVLVVMQNSGLPEAGDAVFSFPREVLADPEAYWRAATLADPPAASARQRRDLAVTGFLRLVQQVEAGRVEALEEFYRQAVALVADRLEAWTRIWYDGPVAAVKRTGEHLEALRDGRIEHLMGAEVHAEDPPPPARRRYGMCGRLDPYSLYYR